MIVLFFFIAFGTLRIVLTISLYLYSDKDIKFNCFSAFNVKGMPKLEVSIQPLILRTFYPRSIKKWKRLVAAAAVMQQQ